jgi:hypothetical protein
MINLGLPGIYYNDLVVCVPRKGDLAGIRISVNGQEMGVTDASGLRLRGPHGSGWVTPVYHTDDAIELRIPWVRPADVAIAPAPPRAAVEPPTQKQRPVFQVPIGKTG